MSSTCSYRGSAEELANSTAITVSWPVGRKSICVRMAAVVCALAVVIAALVVSTPVGSAQAGGGQQRGFALPTWQVNGYDGPDVEQSLREIKTLGATWVELTPTWYQQNRHSNEIYRSSGTVSDAGLIRAIDLAHGVGLKVFLKPHVDLPVPGQDSRNNISPENRDVWFAAYRDFITHYADIAQSQGVEQFAMGTELSTISSDRAKWLPVIAAVRERYSGVVLYAAGRDYATVAFWDALDMIGIDAYLPLGTTPTTDVATLKQAWSGAVGELADMSARYGLQVVFTEAGYTSQLGTTTDPSNWRISRTISEGEQAAAYQALLATFTEQPWWAGVYWWVWITPPYRDAEAHDFSPKGKEAEQVIRQWWAT